MVTDGIQRGSWGPLTLGHPAKISLNVKGNLRLDLEMTLDSSPNGQCGYDGSAVWGNALFYSSK